MTVRDYQSAPDAELLSCFIAGRDERAFAELVARHGQMVQGTAKRILHVEQDAEEAFQATFLALAGAAKKIRRRASVAAWLHQTAVRSAKSMQKSNVKWERDVKRKSERISEAHNQKASAELRELIDVELARLPAKVRAAIVLCDLEGLKRREAASCLGIPMSTLSNHLADGRKRLRSRLAKCGLGMTFLGMVTAMEELSEASTAVTQTMVQKTTANAFAFAAGRTAGDIGLPSSVINTASAIVRATTVQKLTVASIVAAVTLFVGTIAIVLVFPAATTESAPSPLPSESTNRFTAILDNFDDGDATDGKPVAWRVPPVFKAGNYDASSGDFVLARAFAESAQVAYADIPPLRDFSVRAQFQKLAGRGVVSVIARFDPVAMTAYQAGIDPVTNTVYIARNDDRLPDPPILAERVTNLDPRIEEIVLQLDVVGNQLKLFVWPADAPKPRSPTLTATDDNYRIGVPAILIDNRPGHDLSVSFRYVRIEAIGD